MKDLDGEVFDFLVVKDFEIVAAWVVDCFSYLLHDSADDLRGKSGKSRRSCHRFAVLFCSWFVSSMGLKRRSAQSYLYQFKRNSSLM